MPKTAITTYNILGCLLEKAVTVFVGYGVTAFHFQLKADAPK